MAETYFRTEELAVGYDGRALIRQISLSVRRGEIVTLIGPNGAGKSTILKSITRELQLIGGKVWVAGEDMERISPAELSKRMAVVLTERTRPELMTCREVVAAGRYPYTGRLGVLTPQDEEKVTAALERVNALELAYRDFNAVSDGQRQRILLARALCQEPEIIVLDEPTSYLDIRYKLELLHILRTMAREQGITVIMSLHELDLAQKLSDKVVCVKGETIARFGPPGEVFTEEVIRSLYDLEQGAYNADFGSIELPRPTGEPRVFVVSAAGTGIAVYRRLQKEDTPFAAGILFTNDIDYAAARHLAVRTIAARPFRAIGAETLAEAKALVDRCEAVIDAGTDIAEGNAALGELLSYAGGAGKRVSAGEYFSRREETP